MSLPEKYLIISTFPPRKCGIASYAASQAHSLESAGLRVDTLGLTADSDATYSVRLDSVESMWRCLHDLPVESYDKIFFNYSDDWLEIPGRSWSGKRAIAVAQALFLGRLTLRAGPRLVLIAHELKRHPFRGLAWEQVRRWLMKNTAEVQFHTLVERDEAISAMQGALRPEQTRIVEHERYFSPRFSGSRDEARQRLGIDPTRRMALCIGFIQRHKGFDRVVRTIDRLAPEAAPQLFIVGSVRLETPESRAYRDELVAQVQKSPSTKLIEKFVTDEDFDIWIRAADAVILPYREVWSSGVGARAKMLGTRLFAASLPSFDAQFDTYDRVEWFEDEDDLAQLLGAMAESD